MPATLLPKNRLKNRKFNAYVPGPVTSEDRSNCQTTRKKDKQRSKCQTLVTHLKKVYVPDHRKAEGLRARPPGSRKQRVYVPDVKQRVYVPDLC